MPRKAARARVTRKEAVAPPIAVETRTTERLGWIPDLPDRRDHFYSAPTPVLTKLPAKVDLSKKCPPVYDQGHIGSCTANAIAAAVQFDRMLKKQAPAFAPSRLFIYYNERLMEGSVNSDAGAMIRDGIKSVHREGVCPEDLWAYDPNPFPPEGNNQRATVKPSAEAYQAATKYQAIAYHRLVQNNNQMRGCLAEGFPFAFGFTCYESIFSDETTKTGNITIPKDGERPIGGHAILAVGYDDAANVFIIRNSWGPKWGKKGYGTIPYAYMIDPSLSADFWTIRVIEA